MTMHAIQIMVCKAILYHFYVKNYVPGPVSTLYLFGMSGRDLRSFLSQHRSGTLNVSRDDPSLSGKYLAMGATLGGRGIRAVDYSSLLAQAKEHKATAAHQLRKVKRLSKQGQESKEVGLLSLHREVWQREWQHLVNERKRAEVELEEWRANLLCGISSEEKNKASAYWIEDMMEYEADVCQESKQFELDTVKPLQLLRIDLKSWIQTPQGDQCPWEDVQKELISVKQQQKRILLMLQDEYVSLWADLQDIQSSFFSDDKADMEWTVQGIPGAMEMLECPDATLKTSLLEEFHALDQHYLSLLCQLQHKHKPHPPSGVEWSQEDSQRFECIVQQYPMSLPRRRTVYLDRLAREFPQYTRKQLVEQENRLHCKQHLLRQREIYLRSWLAQRRELEVKVQAAVEACVREEEVRKAGKRSKEAQTALCKKLSDKVTRWRKENEEKAMVEAEEVALMQQEAEIQRKREDHMRRRKEERSKVKIQAYRREQEEARSREEAWLQELEVEAQVLKKKGAERDYTRVQYRQEQLLNKRSQQQRALELKAQEERDRERRLELLRQQVQVSVTSDPDRVHQHTQSVQAHLTSDPDLPIQNPLFTFYGFSDHKVTSDPRIRVEEALRKAGLHTSSYARKVMASIKPPTVPRPDQTSSLFK